MRLPKIEMWTDGSTARSNPGPGGFAAVLSCLDTVRIVGGCVPQATNNRAEVLAVCIGLDALKTPCDVTVCTDSRYVINGFARLARGQMLGTNTDIWERAKTALGKHVVQFEQVAGHSGNLMNDLADHSAGYCAYKQATIDERYDNFNAELMAAVTKRYKGMRK